MRHKGIGKEETRTKVIDAASRGFRRHGFSGIGVDGLAKAAGVTSGAFYSHLGSKNKAFKTALVVGLDEVISAIPDFQEKYGVEWINEFCSYYLGKSHRDDLECGCAMASLTSEVVRSDEETKKIFETKMLIIVSHFAKGLEGGSKEERTNRSWAMLGILIGGLNMARAMNKNSTAEKASNAILISAINAAGKATT